MTCQLSCQVAYCGPSARQRGAPVGGQCCGRLRKDAGGGGEPPRGDASLQERSRVGPLRGGARAHRASRAGAEARAQGRGAGALLRAGGDPGARGLRGRLVLPGTPRQDARLRHHRARRGVVHGGEREAPEPGAPRAEPGAARPVSHGVHGASRGRGEGPRTVRRRRGRGVLHQLDRRDKDVVGRVRDVLERREGDLAAAGAQRAVYPGHEPRPLRGGAAAPEERDPEPRLLPHAPAHHPAGGGAPGA